MAAASSKNMYGFPGSVEVGTSASPDGEATPIRRLALTKDALVTRPLDGIDTACDVLDYAARTHGTKNAFGWRDIVDIVEEKKEVKKVVNGKEVTETKTWKYFHLSDYSYISFLQVQEAAREIAGGLLKLDVKKTDILNIYAATRYVISLYARLSRSVGAWVHVEGCPRPKSEYHGRLLESSRPDGGYMRFYAAGCPAGQNVGHDRGRRTRATMAQSSASWACAALCYAVFGDVTRPRRAALLICDVWCPAARVGLVVSFRSWPRSSQPVRGCCCALLLWSESVLSLSRTLRMALRAVALGAVLEGERKCSPRRAWGGLTTCAWYRKLYSGTICHPKMHPRTPP